MNFKDISVVIYFFIQRFTPLVILAFFGFYYNHKINTSEITKKSITFVTFIIIWFRLLVNNGHGRGTLVSISDTADVIIGRIYWCIVLILIAHTTGIFIFKLIKNDK
jgi:hypothetical protein